MSKLRGPLFASDARGNIARLINYTAGRTSAVARAAPRASRSATAAQILRRQQYIEACATWTAFTPEQKSAWDIIARAHHITAFNAFMSNAMQAITPPPPDPEDPHWDLVSLLAVNDNKPNGSTAFADQSTNHIIINAENGATYDESTAPDGLLTSAKNPNTNSRLSVAANAALELDADLTIEIHLRIAAPGTQNIFLLQANAGLSGPYVQLYDGNLYVTGDSGGYIWNTIPSYITADTWTHFALTKAAGVWRAFVAGTLRAGPTNSAETFGPVGKAWSIGNSAIDFALNIPGNYAAARVTKGVARYTADFEPPELPYPTRG